MKGSQDILSSILKTTQMGQVGIRCVMKLPLRATLRTALKEQLEDYDAIEQEAQSIASSRGWILEELDPAVKGMAKMVTNQTCFRQCGFQGRGNDDPRQYPRDHQRL